MREQDYAVHHGQQVEQQEISKVLRNTYSLLALTLAFSGVMAFVAQQMRVGYPNVFVVLIGFYGLFFLTNKLRDSAWGLVSTFALTGFMGFILGPILNRYLGMAKDGKVVKKLDDLMSASRYALMMKRKAITQPKPQRPITGGWAPLDQEMGY